MNYVVNCNDPNKLFIFEYVLHFYYIRIYNMRKKNFKSHSSNAIYLENL